MLVVTMIAGVSVKEVACFLFNQLGVTTKQKELFFNQTLGYYLLWILVITSIISVCLHYYLTKRVIKPVQRLTDSAKQLSHGSFPHHLTVETKDEIGQLTNQFNMLIHQLQRAEKSRKILVNDVSHELRTPLTNINGYLEGLEAGIIAPEPSLFKCLQQEAHYLTSMIDRSQLLNEWEYKSIVAPKKSMNVLQIIEDVLAWYPSFRSYMVVHVDAEIVYMNEDALKQAIINLIDNALSYKKAYSKIHVKGYVKNQRYYLSFHNEGKFISTDDQEKIFDRFYRPDSSRNRNSGGSGLGLAIVKEVITSQNGSVGLRTTGLDHCFWLLLPLKEDKKDEKNV